MSIAAIRFILKCRYDIIGFNISSLTNVIKTILISITIAFFIAYIGNYMADLREFKFPVPGSDLNSIPCLILALALAPIGEETLFRGLLLGYMLEKRVNPWLAIGISAFLFSIIHLIPFSTAPGIQQAYIVGTAFIMSIIAGYLRKQTKSILPAISTHAGFNLGGLIISLLVYG